MKNPILNVQNLKTYFYKDGDISRAVDGISFTIREGETLGLVGESGCGKSVTSLSILRLIPNPPGKIVGGEIHFNGQDILQLPENKMQKIRGNNISIIFQDPMTSLNPAFTCGFQIEETLKLHQKLEKKLARNKTEELLRRVGIPDPAKTATNYPHQLSGGMRQRVMIAMALSCNPQVLIADEPTTALDVTIQSQILNLLQEFQKKSGMAILMITHDMGVIAQVADRVVVMYAGKSIESGTVKEIFLDPKHPYTQGLLLSLPALNQTTDRLSEMPGTVPNPTMFHPGCRFAPRCSFVRDICREREPLPFPVKDEHIVACWMAEEYQKG